MLDYFLPNGKFVGAISLRNPLLKLCMAHQSLYCSTSKESKAFSRRLEVIVPFGEIILSKIFIDFSFKTLVPRVFGITNPSWPCNATSLEGNSIFFGQNGVII